MLSFKQYIQQFLFEATLDHFAHIPDFNPDNPEHKDLVDAFNNGRSENDTNIPKHPNQIKTLEQLKTVVDPHIKKIHEKRQDDKDAQEAISAGHANLVHNSGGVRVYNVANQFGGWAVGQRSKYDKDGNRISSGWCTATKPLDKNSGGMVASYDPEGGHSHVIHLDDEKSPFKKIGIFGKTVTSANFQDQENHKITDEKWEQLRSKHNLDSIPALWGVRGIKMPEEKKQEYSNALSDKISKDKHTPFDLSHASRNGYLSNEHVKSLSDNLSNKIINGTHTDKELVHAKNNGYLTDEHIQQLPIGLSKKINNGTHTDADLDHAVESGYLNENHKKLLAKHLEKELSDPKSSVSYGRQRHIEKYGYSKHLGDKVLSKFAANAYLDEDKQKILSHRNTGPLALSALADRYDIGQNPDIINSLIKHKHFGGVDVTGLRNLLRKSDAPNVRKAIINHPNFNSIPPSDLNKLSKSDDPEVHKAVVNHPSFDKMYLYDRELGDLIDSSNDPDVHKKVLAHRNTTHNIIGKVIYKSNDPDVHRAIINHRNFNGVGPHALEHLAHTSNDPEVHHAIMNNSTSILMSREAKNHILSKYGLESTGYHRDDVTNLNRTLGKEEDIKI